MQCFCLFSFQFFSFKQQMQLANLHSSLVWTVAAVLNKNGNVMVIMTAKITLMSLDVQLSVPGAKSHSFSASLSLSALTAAGFVMVKRTVKIERMRKNVVCVVLVQVVVERGLEHITWAFFVSRWKQSCFWATDTRQKWKICFLNISSLSQGAFILLETIQ